MGTFMAAARELIEVNLWFAAFASGNGCAVAAGLKVTYSSPVLHNITKLIFASCHDIMSGFSLSHVFFEALLKSQWQNKLLLNLQITYRILVLPTGETKAVLSKFNSSPVFNLTETKLHIGMWAHQSSHQMEISFYSPCRSMRSHCCLLQLFVCRCVVTQCLVCQMEGGYCWKKKNLLFLENFVSLVLHS